MVLVKEINTGGQLNDLKILVALDEFGIERRHIAPGSAVKSFRVT
jgi:hypothetical protein